MSSFPPSQTNTSSQAPNCEWIMTVTNCFDQDYFQLIYGVTAYFALFIFLCSIWLLSWRLYSNPDTKLFKIEGFLTLEGYLFIQIFWGAARVISCLMFIYDLFPGQWIVRLVTMDLSWFLGLISVVTYLAGVLRTIPRMYFYRQNPHYKHSLHLPTLRGVASVYTSYILVNGIIRITCAVLMGYLGQYHIEEYQLIRILRSIYFSTCSIGSFLLVIGFLIYGNKLVGIASEGLHLLEGVSGYPSKKKKSSRVSHTTTSTFVMGAELELKHEKLQRSVRKMRIINLAFILTFMVMGVVLGLLAFLYDPIMTNTEISKVLSAITNWLPLILNVGVMGGIAYGEMRVPDKSEPRLDNIIISSFSNSTSNTAQSPQSPVIEYTEHSRNNSTDSDAPLLRWPAPVVTSTRRGSAQLDSPISVISSSSSSTIGSSALPTSSTNNK